jgi:hypothetical protein
LNDNCQAGCGGNERESVTHFQLQTVQNHITIHMTLPVDRCIGLTLVFLSLCSSSFAQNIFREGFFINENRDTIRGFIKPRGDIKSPNGFYFKKTNDSAVEELQPARIEVVVITDYRYFRSILINEVPSYAQTLVDGKARLFLRDKDFFIQNSDRIQLLNIEEVKVGTTVHRKMNYIGVLKSTMSDCPQVDKTIDKTRLDESSLTSLVESYNRCVRSNTLVYKKNIPLFRIKYSPLIAVSYAKLTVDVTTQFRGVLGYLEEADLSQVSISPGIGFTLSSPRIDDRFSFYTELRYVKTSMNDLVISEMSTYDINDITINYTYIYLPITVKYNFALSPNSSLFLKGGLIQTFKLDAEFINVRSFSLFPNSPPVVEKDKYDFYSSQTGLTGGLGYQLKLGRKTELWTELRIENTGPLINSNTVGFLQNIYSLVTAISF